MAPWEICHCSIAYFSRSPVDTVDKYSLKRNILRLHCLYLRSFLTRKVTSGQEPKALGKNPHLAYTARPWGLRSESVY